MAFTASTILDQQEIRPDGTINLRFAKKVMNGDKDVSSEWHRTSLPPGIDIDAQLSAVSAHLVEMGYPAVSGDDISKVKSIAAVTWTEDVVAAYAANVAAQSAPV